MRASFLAIAIAATVARTGTAFADSRPSLIAAVTKPARNLDPMGQNANVNERVRENIIGNLIRYNWKIAKLQSGLATQWEMINDSTLQLKTRDGAKCHDDAFTADDVEIMFGAKRYASEGVLSVASYYRPALPVMR